jgi:hypothetical protein
VAVDAIWTSAVAVSGTLLGSVVTYPFQRLASKQQRLNEERIVAYTAFATAVEAFRYGQAERFFRWQDDPTSDAYRAAYHEGHRLRSVAWQAFYRVQLIADDPATCPHTPISGSAAQDGRWSSRSVCSPGAAPAIGASRFRTGLVTCFATHDGIPAVAAAASRR